MILLEPGSTYDRYNLTGQKTPLLYKLQWHEPYQLTDTNQVPSHYLITYNV